MGQADKTSASVIEREGLEPEADITTEVIEKN